MMDENIDWGWWLERWDKQQTGYLPDRESRYSAMFDVLEAQLPEEFLAIDLASGPGFLSQRLLDRFSKAKCIAVDLDPVLLALGQGSLGNIGGRLRWVEVDINEESWVDSLDAEQVDAVLSTTALCLERGCSGRSWL
jgi:trans-aconitate methyltransferase